jgi:hypothetical protein
VEGGETGELIRRTRHAIYTPMCDRYLRPRLPEFLAAAMDPDTRALATAHGADVVLLVDGTEFPVDDPDAFDLHHFMFSNKGKHVCGQSVVVGAPDHRVEFLSNVFPGRFTEKTMWVEQSMRDTLLAYAQTHGIKLLAVADKLYIFAVEKTDSYEFIVPLGKQQVPQLSPEQGEVTEERAKVRVPIEQTFGTTKANQRILKSGIEIRQHPPNYLDRTVGLSFAIGNARHDHAAGITEDQLSDVSSFMPYAPVSFEPNLPQLRPLSHPTRKVSAHLFSTRLTFIVGTG